MVGKKHRKLRHQQYGFKCAWCASAIADDVELFGISAKAQPDFDLTNQEGRIIDIYLEHARRKAPAIVVAKDSPAKRQGHDLYFVACSEECASELREVVAREI